jgi:hypothetical protein
MIFFFILTILSLLGLYLPPLASRLLYIFLVFYVFATLASVENFGVDYANYYSRFAAGLVLLTSLPGSGLSSIISYHGLPFASYQAVIYFFAAFSLYIFASSFGNQKCFGLTAYTLFLPLIAYMPYNSYDQSISVSFLLTILAIYMPAARCQGKPLPNSVLIIFLIFLFISAHLSSAVPVLALFLIASIPLRHLIVFRCQLFDFILPVIYVPGKIVLGKKFSSSSFLFLLGSTGFVALFLYSLSSLVWRLGLYSAGVDSKYTASSGFFFALLLFVLSLVASSRQLTKNAISCNPLFVIPFILPPFLSLVFAFPTLIMRLSFSLLPLLIVPVILAVQDHTVHHARARIFTHTVIISFGALLCFAPALESSRRLVY